MKCPIACLKRHCRRLKSFATALEISGYNACEGKSKKCMNQLMVEMGDKRDVVDGDEIKVIKEIKIVKNILFKL
jgi:alanine racemase